MISLTTFFSNTFDSILDFTLLNYDFKCIVVNHEPKIYLPFFYKSQLLERQYIMMMHVVPILSLRNQYTNNFITNTYTYIYSILLN